MVGASVAVLFPFMRMLLGKGYLKASVQQFNHWASCLVVPALKADVVAGELCRCRNAKWVHLQRYGQWTCLALGREILHTLQEACDTDFHTSMPCMPKHENLDELQGSEAIACVLGFIRWSKLECVGSGHGDTGSASVSSYGCPPCDGGHPPLSTTPVCGIRRQREGQPRLVDVPFTAPSAHGSCGGHGTSCPCQSRCGCGELLGALELWKRPRWMLLDTLVEGWCPSHGADAALVG
jgi:hypothetical protein